MRKMKATDVAQLDVFHLLPEAFDRIEIRGVSWETLQMEASGGFMRV
jgi:hypothetical protein